ncbi:hypothetical protein R0J90_18750, partial [Micrococcus sp. SIMBA_144]
ALNEKYTKLKNEGLKGFSPADLIEELITNMRINNIEEYENVLMLSRKYRRYAHITNKNIHQKEKNEFQQGKAALGFIEKRENKN